MMLRSALARVIVSMAGAMPMALTATARAQDLNAYCAKVGNDDRVKPIPAAMVPAARRLFNLESADDADFVFRSHRLSLHERLGLAVQPRGQYPMRQSRFETHAAERHHLLQRESQRSYRAHGRDWSRYNPLVGMRGRQGAP